MPAGGREKLWVSTGSVLPALGSVSPHEGQTHPRFWEPSLPPSSSRAAARFPLRAVLHPGDLPGEIPPFYGP